MIKVQLIYSFQGKKQGQETWGSDRYSLRFHLYMMKVMVELKLLFFDILLESAESRGNQMMNNNNNGV